MGLFQDRRHAGQLLAEKLTEYSTDPNVLVLALPRGGVPVGYEVARALQVPLDVFLVRKLGVPGRQELAMGAIVLDGAPVLNHEVLSEYYISQAAIDQVIQKEHAELQRQQLLYRQDNEQPVIKDRTIILVDDGLATGSTMRAAVKAMRREKPAYLVIAAPVGATETCNALRTEADKVICAVESGDFVSVGSWYRDFRPTSDEEVQFLLQKAETEWRDSNEGSLNATNRQGEQAARTTS